MPALACATAGIYGCGIQESAHLNIKTRHCISGCGRVVLWLRRNAVHSMKSIFDFRTLMYHPSFTLNDNPLTPCRHGGSASAEWGDPPSPTLLGLTPVVASRHREEEQRSDPFTTDWCKICFQKKNIHFISSLLSDNKRLLSTTNVCSTDRSWQTMHLCDIIQTHLLWLKRIHLTKSNQQRFHFLN